MREEDTRYFNAVLKWRLLDYLALITYEPVAESDMIYDMI